MERQRIRALIIEVVNLCILDCGPMMRRYDAVSVKEKLVAAPVTNHSEGFDFAPLAEIVSLL